MQSIRFMRTGSCLGRVAARNFSINRVLLNTTQASSTPQHEQSQPSTPEMKSSSNWSAESPTSSDSIEYIDRSSGNSSLESKPSANIRSTISSRLVDMTRDLQDSTEPPLSIDRDFTRDFKAGQTYDPFDFSQDKIDIETRERRTDFALNRAKGDPFVRAGIDPRDLYTMPDILSKFVSQTGQILPRNVTGCNGKNQKKLGIAIKRARAAGVLPSVHRTIGLPSRIL